MLKPSSTRSERLSFAGSQGHTLSARLERPDGEPRAYALFAHCFTCTKNLKSEVWISRTLVGHGIAVLRFDFTGLGESGGSFADTNFTSNVGDVQAAADFLREQYAAPRLLIGHSLGGTATLVAAENIPEARAVVTLASPSDTDHLRETLVAQAPDLLSSGQAAVDIGGVSYTVKKQLIEDLRRQHVLEHIATLDRALLVIHSQGDETVPISHGERIFAAAKYPKAFVSLRGADHLLLGNRTDGPWVGNLIAQWSSRFLEA